MVIINKRFKRIIWFVYAYMAADTVNYTTYTMFDIDSNIMKIVVFTATFAIILTCLDLIFKEWHIFESGG